MHKSDLRDGPLGVSMAAGASMPVPSPQTGILPLEFLEFRGSEGTLICTWATALKKSASFVSVPELGGAHSGVCPIVVSGCRFEDRTSNRLAYARDAIQPRVEPRSGCRWRQARRCMCPLRKRIPPSRVSRILRVYLHAGKSSEMRSYNRHHSFPFPS